MGKTYYYQPHIRYSEGPVGWFFAALIAGCPVLPFLLGCRAIDWQYPAVRLSAYLAATLICMAVLMRMVCRQWKYARIVVTDDSVICYGPFLTRRIAFADVTRFRHFHFFYWAGIAVARTKTSTVVLPFVIQDAADCIRTVAARLNGRGMDTVFKSERFRRFIRAARINDIINNKIFGELPALAFMTMLSLAGSAFIAVYVWCAFFIAAILWTIIGFAIPLAAYLAANTLIAFHVAAGIDSGRAAEIAIDTPRIYSWIGLAAGIVYLCLGIIFKWCFVNLY